MKKTDWQFLIDALMFTCIFAVIIIGILMGFFLDQGPTGQGTAKYFLGLHRHQWGDLHFVVSLAFCGLLILHLAMDWNWIKAKAKRFFKSAWIPGLALIVVLPLALLAVAWSLSEKNNQDYSEFGSGSDHDNEGREFSSQSADLASADFTGAPLSAATVEGMGETPAAAFPEAVGGEPPGRQASHAGNNNDAHALSHKNEKNKIVAGRRSESSPTITITGQMTLLEVERSTGVPASVIANHLGLPASVSLNTQLGRLRKIYGFSLEDVRAFVAGRLDKR